MDYCLNCDESLTSVIDEEEPAGTIPARTETRGRKQQYCSVRCRVAYHRRLKRYKSLLDSVTKKPRLDGILILELFPGAGLFGKAFEALGAVVVRGPDILFGGDIRDFRGIKGRFDGIIGGPPCQPFSKASVEGTRSFNLIPEFLRVVDECQPSWAVMENVREARPYAPDWDYSFIRDWDCGGKTHRIRGFWFCGMDAPPKPKKCEGYPTYSVLASSWARRGKTAMATPYYTPHEAAELQGFPGLAEKIIDNQAGWLRSNGEYIGVSRVSREVIATHMLGNGVPFAMGSYIAQYVAYQLLDKQFQKVSK